MEKLTKEFSKSQCLEDALSRVNKVIANGYINDAKKITQPLMLTMGCPRSGTTLFMQWLAGLGCFGYPTNLIARFYSNPAFGCEVQKALVDYDKENQISLGQQQSFDSSLGRTQGALAPSEFWYFWREYFKFNGAHELSENELKLIDADALVENLAAMEKSLGKPLVMKGMLLNWHIEYLSEICSKFFFAYIRRDLFYVAQSILESRERYCGTREGWWSFKPPGHENWLALSPIEQVAAQAVNTQKAVEKGMSALPEDRKIHIDYAQLCRDPEAVFERLAEKYAQLNCDIKAHNKSWDSFNIREEVRLVKSDEMSLRNAIEKFASAEAG